MEKSPSPRRLRPSSITAVLYATILARNYRNHLSSHAPTSSGV